MHSLNHKHTSAKETPKLRPERYEHSIRKPTAQKTQEPRTQQKHPDSETDGKHGTFREAREYGGTPLSYFPEMIPQASGDHVIAPTPKNPTDALLMIEQK